MSTKQTWTEIKHKTGLVFKLFFVASNSFWNTQNLCSTMSWLQELYIATFSFFTCNFYQVGLLRKM